MYISGITGLSQWFEYFLSHIFSASVFDDKVLERDNVYLVRRQER